MNEEDERLWREASEHAKGYIGLTQSQARQRAAEAGYTLFVVPPDGGWLNNYVVGRQHVLLDIDGVVTEAWAS